MEYRKKWKEIVKNIEITQPSKVTLLCNFVVILYNKYLQLLGYRLTSHDSNCFLLLEFMKHLYWYYFLKKCATFENGNNDIQTFVFV